MDPVAIQGEEPQPSGVWVEGLQKFTGRFTIEVPRHGAVMIRVGRPGG